MEIRPHPDRMKMNGGKKWRAIMRAKNEKKSVAEVNTVEE